MTDPEAQLDASFAALADPTRRAIVRRLLAGDCTVGDLAAPFEMSLAAVSKHLAILTRAGLVSQSREGRTKWCRLEVESLHAAALWIESFGGFTAQDLDLLERHLDADDVDDDAGEDALADPS